MEDPAFMIVKVKTSIRYTFVPVYYIILFSEGLMIFFERNHQ